MQLPGNPNSRVGNFEVRHIGKNDWRVYNRCTGELLFKGRQLSQAFSRAQHYNQVESCMEDWY